MKAGRELDRLIGEKIFGYSIYHYDKDYREHCYYLLWDIHGDAVNQSVPLSEAERKTEAECWEHDCPHFSTDMTAAWQVFIKLTEFTGGVKVWSDMEEWGEEAPVCVSAETNDSTWIIRWQPFPLAICLLALATCGVEVAS
jgi:hypothetical protein